LIPAATFKPVVVLISGRGSNMCALVEQARVSAPFRVCGVISNKEEAAGVALARGFGIPVRVLTADNRARDDYDRALGAAIDEWSPALVVLAGFMRILSAGFVDRYAGRIMNIHPSLLPKHPGLHTHRRVLEAGDAEHGATVHFVTAELDGGPPIIQARVPVQPGDDENGLAARVQACEHVIYPLAVRWFCEGRLSCRGGQAWLDGRALTHPVLQE